MATTTEQPTTTESPTTTTETPTTTTETPTTTTPPPCDETTLDGLEKDIKTLISDINDLKEQRIEVENNYNQLFKKYFEPSLLCTFTQNGDPAGIENTIIDYQLKLNELYSQKYLIEQTNQVIIYKDDEQGNPVEEIKTDKTFIKNQLEIIDKYISYNNETLKILQGNQKIDNKNLAKWCKEDNAAYEENMNFFKNTIDSLTAQIENKNQEIQNKNNQLSACGRNSVTSKATEDWQIRDFYNDVYKRAKTLELI